MSSAFLIRQLLPPCRSDVIISLVNGDAHVPYRNSKLTTLLRDSLGGNAKTLMFVNISPASSNEEETLGSLGYATRASLIKNEVKKHEDSAEVQRLKKIVRLLLPRTPADVINHVAAGCRSRGCRRSRATARGLPAAPHLRRRADGCAEAEDADREGPGRTGLTRRGHTNASGYR